MLAKTAEEQKSETVQIFVVQESGVLLVHNLGEDRGKSPAKPAGWGMPGGGVNPAYTTDDLAEQIVKFFPVCKITQTREEAVKLLGSLPDNSKIDLEHFLTAIKEGIEETGFLILPIRLLFKEENNPRHTVIVLLGEIIGGKLQKRNIETDDCDRFLLSDLPADLYNSHRSRIEKACRILGINVGVPQHESDQEVMGGVL